MPVHPNTARERRIAKLLEEASSLEGEARSLDDRACFLEGKVRGIRNQIEELEKEALPPLIEPDGLVHRIQTHICPECGLGDAAGHYDCRGAIPVPIVIYLPDVRDLLTPFKNPSIIPYQGDFQAVLRVESVKPGTRRDAAREFGPESTWREPSKLKED